MIVVLFTLLDVLIFGSLSMSLNARSKTSDQRVTQTNVGGRNGKIAFTSNRDGNYEIYTMEANGSNQTRLTNSPYDASPKWSPDGTKIAFLRSDGFQPYHVARLFNTHPGDFREMIRGFVDSTEYRRRFGQP